MEYHDKKGSQFTNYTILKEYGTSDVVGKQSFKNRSMNLIYYTKQHWLYIVKVSQ